MFTQGIAEIYDFANDLFAALPDGYHIAGYTCGKDDLQTDLLSEVVGTIVTCGVAVAAC